MNRNEFRQLFEKGPVLLDGATGSNLMKAGMPKGVCAEQWILDHPEALIELQRAYAGAGSQIIYAPTFTANSFYLSQHGLEGETARINRELVALSRQAAPDAILAGDMTTPGKPDLPYEQLLEIYTQQAAALRDAGVDVYIAETLMSAEEAMAALEACRLVSDLPFLCSFSVMGDGMLYFGGSVLEAAPQAAEFGADAVGVNCSAGPDQMATVIRNLAQTVGVPVIAKPNAGMPVIDDEGHAVYAMSPEEFAGQMRRLRQEGASLLGGCCGTEPAHIAALASVMKK